MTAAAARIRHRIRGHRAALQLADYLGAPDRLRPSIVETEARLSEAEQILAIVEEDDP